MLIDSAHGGHVGIDEAWKNKLFFVHCAQAMIPTKAAHPLHSR